MKRPAPIEPAFLLFFKLPEIAFQKLNEKRKTLRTKKLNNNKIQDYGKI